MKKLDVPKVKKIIMFTEAELLNKWKSWFKNQ